MTLWQKIKKFFTPPQLWKVTVRFTEGEPLSLLTGMDPKDICTTFRYGCKFRGRTVEHVELKAVTPGWMLKCFP